VPTAAASLVRGLSTSSPAASDGRLWPSRRTLASSSQSRRCEQRCRLWVRAAFGRVSRTGACLVDLSVYRADAWCLCASSGYVAHASRRPSGAATWRYATSAAEVPTGPLCSRRYGGCWYRSGIEGGRERRLVDDSKASVLASTTGVRHQALGNAVRVGDEVSGGGVCTCVEACSFVPPDVSTAAQLKAGINLVRASSGSWISAARHASRLPRPIAV